MFPIISYQPDQTFAIKLFFLGGFQFLMLLLKCFIYPVKYPEFAWREKLAQRQSMQEVSSQVNKL